MGMFTLLGALAVATGYWFPGLNETSDSDTVYGAVGEYTALYLFSVQYVWVSTTYVHTCIHAYIQYCRSIS